MTNLDSILKSRNITLPTKVSLIKAMIFLVVIYGCEMDHKGGWAVKNFRAGEDSCPLDSKEIKPVIPKGNQPWIFIVRTDAEAGAPMLGHLIRRAYSLEKTLMLGKIGGKRRRGRQRMRWLNSITESINMSLHKLRVHFRVLKESDMTWQLNNNLAWALWVGMKVTGLFWFCEQHSNPGYRLQKKMGGGGTDHSLFLPFLLLINLPCLF